MLVQLIAPQRQDREFDVVDVLHQLAEIKRL